MTPLLVTTTFALAAATTVMSRPAVPLLQRLSPKRLLGLDLDSIFDGADVDGDGLVCSMEFYDVVIRKYITANRQGLHLDAPERDVIEALFKRADTDGDGRLSRSEFKVLAPVLQKRLSLRIATFVTMRFVISPFLAWSVVDMLKGRPWIPVLRGMVPPRIAKVAGQFIFTDDLWRAVFLVTSMSVLGSGAMSLLNSYLERMPFAERVLGEGEQARGQRGREAV